MRHRLSLFVIALMTTTTVVMGAAIFSNAPPVHAQFGGDPEVMASQVYETLPDFPRENQYIHRKKKRAVEDNTLISRLIRYHTFNMARSPQYRLDWKITLADYLGLNQYITPQTYPGATFLKENPFERDQSIIQGLDRGDREALIQAIVDVYDPKPVSQRTPTQQKPTQPPPQSSTRSESATDLMSPSAPNPPSLEKPEGAARFLLIDETP